MYHQQSTDHFDHSCFNSQELDLVESSATVYKMIGPVLVKQDVEEARQNVQKRIDYINGEM